MKIKEKTKSKGMMKFSFNLNKEYNQAFSYIKESEKFIYAAIILFFGFFLLGFFIHPPEILSNQFLKFLAELIEKTKNFNGYELMGYIFLNNFLSSLQGMFFGFFFGVYSFVAIVFNGYFVGFVSSLSVKSMGVLVLWRLLPHGIFELPAIFISFGLGLKFGTFIFKKKKFESFSYYLFNNIRIFLLIILPLLIIAALIEGFLIAFFG